MTWAVLLVGAYLLGSVSWSYLLVRLARAEDVRRVGSGNAGATNVLRIWGLGPALCVLGLDVAKGAAAVAAARWLDAPGPVVGGAAAAAVVGHVFPVFLGFRGGKGVATACGAFVILAPWAGLFGSAVFLVAVAATRYVAVGSIVAIGLFPVLAAVSARWRGTEAPLWLLISSAAIAALIIVLHRDNIRRMRAGTEWQLGKPPPQTREPTTQGEETA